MFHKLIFFVTYFAPSIKVPLIGRNKIGNGAVKIEMKQELLRFKHIKNLK